MWCSGGIEGTEDFFAEKQNNFFASTVFLVSFIVCTWMSTG